MVEFECTIVSKSTIATKNVLFPTFSNQKPKGPNLTVPLNKSRSTQGHHLYKFQRTISQAATYQVSRQSAQWFWKKSFKVLPYIYVVMVAILVVLSGQKNINFLFPHAWWLHMKFNSNWSSSFRRKPFENVDRQLTYDL